KHRFMDRLSCNPPKIMFTANLNNSFIYDEYRNSFPFIDMIRTKLLYLKVFELFDNLKSLFNRISLP
ncbi:MAG: hypothetical protein ACRD8K_07810, partial [Nitrososphaeraceae archaeon]